VFERMKRANRDSYPLHLHRTLKILASAHRPQHLGRQLVVRVAGGFANVNAVVVCAVAQSAVARVVPRAFHRDDLGRPGPKEQNQEAVGHAEGLVPVRLFHDHDHECMCLDLARHNI
jgi:hypothetical protein